MSQYAPEKWVVVKIEGGECLVCDEPLDGCPFLSKEFKERINRREYEIKKLNN